MEDCKTLELSIEETKMFVENGLLFEGKPNLENLFKTSGQSTNSTCSLETALVPDNAKRPQSCGSIYAFNLHQKIIFKCEFCNLKYADLENLGSHLLEAHNLLLQIKEPEGENSGSKREISRISNVVKKERAIDLPPSYFTESLVFCGNVFVLKERIFSMACGHCDCSNYDNFEMFKEHIKQQHNILEVGQNELTVEPKAKTKAGDFIIHQVGENKIKNEQREKENEAGINEERNSEENDEDEEIESGEEFLDIECGEENHQHEECELEDDDEKSIPKDTTKKKNEKITGEFNCDLCHKGFRNLVNLNTHKRRHNGDAAKRYNCEFCSSKFHSNFELKIHLRRIHTGEKPFKCGICEKDFPTRAAVICHRRIHTGERPFKCDICQKDYRDKTALIRHKNTHMGDAGKHFKCEFCSRKYFTKQALQSHSSVHTDGKPLQCDICQRDFKGRVTLMNHKRTHMGEAGKRHNCEFCSKKFGTKFEINVHIRTHTGEKPFKCNICQKDFAKKYILTCHKRTHTGEKPFKCDICQKDFRATAALAAHKTTHTVKKPQCIHCDQKFTRKDHFAKHYQKCKILLLNTKNSNN